MELDELLGDDPLWKAIKKRGKEIDRIFSAPRTKENLAKGQEDLAQLAREITEEVNKDGSG